jgi:fluoride ion exporter CrcB/FEX
MELNERPGASPSRHGKHGRLGLQNDARSSNGCAQGSTKYPQRSPHDGPDESWEEEAQDEGFNGLGEIDAPPPDEDPNDERSRQRASLEDTRTESQRRSGLRPKSLAAGDPKPPPKESRFLTQLYTYSWLIFFSIFGTLARIGTQWITKYPNAPVATNELWANVGGCFVMGFLMEDRALFRDSAAKGELDAAPLPRIKIESDSSSEAEKAQTDLTAIQRELEKRKTSKAHLSHKKTLPLYIGLSVGFCGSYTSFSSFMRDAFLAMSNDIVLKNAGPGSRSAGWSVCAALAVFIAETGLSLAALSAGAHFCEALSPHLNRIPAVRISHILNPLGAVLGGGCWLGAIFLAIWPPQNRWRADCVFAIVFAPLGCLLRFQLAIMLNNRVPRFPTGTFVANIIGSIILAMAFDLQHAPIPSAGGLIGGGMTGCQVLQGIMDGFCGCLTTVSTWVAELKGLRKRHAYEYGFASIAVGFSFMVVIIGPLHWTIGLSRPLCTN